MQTQENEVVYLHLDDIIPNRFQPRQVFDEKALKELAVSIKEHGVIQPIIVRNIGNKYEIIAGERRYKASALAGLTTIPAIIRNLDDKESSKVALLENLQRKNLNPIEEAKTYQKILELDQMTQEELAKTMGKSQSAVANKLRLLSLTDEVQDALLKEEISERHARTLLSVTDKEEQKRLLKEIINNKMTVRELEEKIKPKEENITPQDIDNMLNPQIIDELKQIANVKSLKTLGNLSSLKIVDGGYSTIYDSDLMKARARKGNKLEVLEFYGDIQKPDGTILKNYLVTVVARTKVVRFEPNPFVINPFIYASIIEDPETKRGVSPLKVAMILSSISSEILNKQLDALSLTINPPYLAPKGCFKGEQVVTPGKIIEYDSALMPQQPLPLDFTQAVRGWDFIRFFKAQIESATGIFKNMSGQLEQDVEKTATEFTYSVSSQAIRLNMLIDSISRKIIIPMIQAVAEITSNFKFGNETVVYSENGAVKFIDINDNVRCSYDFLYRYGDRKASIDRKSKFSQLFNLISSFAKIPDFTSKINWDKCFKYALEQFGVENTQAFINENVPANNTTLPSNQITNGSKH